ncbi:hypothetical protein BD413DRAFT_251591 [Trametes elegans]|nr:hypothetical protein BD413DRAFT_251591 [Trametes elegans]
MARSPHRAPIPGLHIIYDAMPCRYSEATRSACLLYYDYTLTLSDEHRILWRGRRSLATALYVAIRYGAILLISLTLLHDIHLTSTSGPYMTVTSCQVLLYATLTLNTINYVVISAFVALRISAIWSRNASLGACMFVLGLVNPAFLTPLLGFGLKNTPAPWPSTACVVSLKDADSLVPLTIAYFPIISSATTIVYELLCLLLTVLKTFSLYQEQRRLGISARLTSLLLRDGSIYFAALSALAVLNIVAATIPPGSLPMDFQVNTVVARVLTPILITRFIVALRTVDLATSSVSDGRLSELSYHLPTI